MQSMNKISRYKQNLAIAGLFVIALSFVSCDSATALPLDWSQSQKQALVLKYSSRDAIGVKGFYKKHEARQLCVNLKQYGQDWFACLDWITGGLK